MGGRFSTLALEIVRLLPEGQFESALISERVKAGMERARTQGKPLGRPRIPEDIKDEIQRLRSEFPPVSPRQISKLLGIGYGTARRYVKVLEAKSLQS